MSRHAEQEQIARETGAAVLHERLARQRLGFGEVAVDVAQDAEELLAVDLSGSRR